MERQQNLLADNQNVNNTESLTYMEPRWLVEERDACGVGLVANRENKANHEIIKKALAALTCLEHRGGCSADKDSGDGAGLMTAIPWELLQQWFALQNIAMPSKENLAVGMMFLPQNLEEANKVKQVAEQILQQEDIKLLGWRVVPVQPQTLGVQAKENQPQIEQLIVESKLASDELERQLYISRRRIVKAIGSLNLQEADAGYFCSFSSRTIVYKGMVRSAVLGDFYPDLKNPIYQSAFAIYHRRFSTNTMPKWPLAQPMRLLGHNGEINTLLGNINWMMAREADLDHPVWENRLDELKPL
jgi:glutamate synthase (ferredoxin)